MDSKLSPALAKRLAAYSGSAAITLAVTQGRPAEAQVVYYDVVPDIETCGMVNLDFDDDRVVDLKILPEAYPFYSCYHRERTYTYRMVLRRPRGVVAENGILGYGVPGLPNPDAAAASRLSSGEVVGPPTPGQGFYSYAVLASSLGIPEAWPFSGEEGYAGFRFIGSDGEHHFGWLRLFVRESGTFATLYAYAYEATPNTPIVAGARSAALLDGDVSQTVFPPSGGTLVYTFTAENTTDEPLPLDLWVDQSRPNGGPGHTKLLGSGTLPPHAMITRSVSLNVPAYARAGRHGLRFRLGDFETKAFITFERYFIRKEVGAGAMGEVADEPFTVAPLGGDLFGDAAGPEALAGTHALGAPSPNPSDGRTALTLRVSEPQHVTVAVHDALGRRVALLYDGALSAGETHRLGFDGSGLPTGVYVVRAVGERFSDTRVVTLMR